MSEQVENIITLGEMFADVEARKIIASHSVILASWRESDRGSAGMLIKGTAAAMVAGTFPFTIHCTDQAAAERLKRLAQGA